MEPWSVNLDTLIQNVTPYSYEHSFILAGTQMMALQGVPDGQAPPSQFKDSECRSLAGEAYFAASMATATAAFFLNPWAPWWKPDS